MKQTIRLFAWFVLAAGLYATGCEITTDYPEMDSKPQPTLCDSDSDCLDGVCDLKSGTCVECLGDEQCPLGKFCNPASNQCATCFADTQCPTGVCDEADGICRECQSESDCSSGKCDIASGVCIECGANADCVTSNPCEVGVCVAGRCSFGEMPEGLACEDNDPCTQGDVCQMGKCVGGPVLPDCQIPPDPCAVDASGKMAPEGTPCDDGNPCTLDDFCYLGKCQGDTISPDCVGEDLDGDGFSSKDGDCNDTDPTMNPAAPELCDSIDNDCDGMVDEECSGECIIGGCNGELCLDASMMDKPSNCLWLPEYQCLMYTTCGPYAPGGVCGWIKTPEYVECLQNIQTPCMENGYCPDGTICDPATGTCQPYVVPCYTSAECGYMEVCVNGQCQPGTGECKDLGGVDLGACDMVVGVAYQFGKCTWISGCGCDPYCEVIFQSIEQCEAACGITTPCYSNDQCAYGEVCMNGVCVVNGPYCMDLGGIDFGDCEMAMGVALQFGKCNWISGCGCGDYCDAFFQSFEQCEAACFGTCTGTPEVCDGMDNDCDGLVDEEVCGACDDGNPCTKDYLTADGTCYSEEVSCEDGDPCTYDYCDPTVGGCVSKWSPDCGGIPCVADVDCPQGTACMNGVCQVVTTGCYSDSQCGSGSYCYFSSCAVETGSCTAIPQACDMMFKPVCGCNGLTYGNLCLLMQSKQDLAYEGTCQIQPVDNDGDGYPKGTDCDDTNSQIYPGAAEVCDGMDNDCDGMVDENCGFVPCNTDSDCKPWQACMNGACMDMPD